MPEHKNDNLVIWALRDEADPDSGALFSVPKEVYTSKEFLLEGPGAAQPRMLLSFGTVVADMFEDGTGAGGFCYLINLPALQPPTISPDAATRASRPVPQLSPAELAGAIRHLVKKNEIACTPSADAHPFVTGLKNLLESTQSK